MVNAKLTIIILGSIFQCSSSYSSTSLDHRSHDYGHAVDDANDVNGGHDGYGEHGSNAHRKTSKRRLEPRRPPFNTGTNNGNNEDYERDDRSYNGGSSYGYDSSSNSGYNSQNRNSYGASSSYGGSPSSSISSTSSYGSSSYGGSGSGGSYRSSNRNRGYNNFRYDYELPRIPLAWVILIIISNTTIAILLTAHQFENNPEGNFANFCRLCNNTLDCLYRLVYNCYHCRLNEIPTVVCAEDDDEDAYSEQELQRMKLRPGVGRALEVEHHKAMRKTLQKNASSKGSKKAPPRRESMANADTSPEAIADNALQVATTREGELDVRTCDEEICRIL